MGERQGSSNNNVHGVDEFAGIGTHAHEIGHLLGLNHGEGDWTDSVNRYGNLRPYRPPNEVRGGANHMGWTLMQSGAEGPVLNQGYNPNGYWTAYRSCPHPLNPFYLSDLGWLTPTEIVGSHNDYEIAPGTTHLIDRGGVEFLLNRRTTESFGGRYVSFYDYDAANAANQGLMIWRRPPGTERPMLIVADERRYTDARNTDQNPAIQEYFDMLSDPFAAGRVEDPRPNTDTFDQANVSAATSRISGAGLHQTTTGSWGHAQRRFDLALTNIEYDQTRTNILVDVSIESPDAPVVSAEVGANQVTLRWDADDDDPTVSYQYQYRAGTDPWSQPTTLTTTEAPLTGLTNNTSYTFEVSTVNGLGTSTTTLTATPQEMGSSTVDFPEDVTPDQDDTPPVASYTVTGLGDTPEWSLVDDTREAFELQGTGATRTLHFQQPPDYETPTTADPDPVYPVIIQAQSDPVTVTQAVTVTVTDVDEDGTVTLSTTTPVVGAEVTATLEDPDVPVTNELWTWQRRVPDSETVEDARAPLQSLDDLFQPTFTPSVLDVGRELRASVSYRDVHSSSDGFGLSLLDKSAHSVWTAPVWSVLSGLSPSASYTPVRADLGQKLRATVKYVPDAGSYYRFVQSEPTHAAVMLPSPTGFEVWPDHESVLLKWDDPDDDSITHWGYGKRKRPAPMEWTEVADEEVPSLQYEGRTIRYIRVDGLTNGVEYLFKVRVKAADAEGVPTDPVRVTPVQPTVAYGASSYEAQEGGAPVPVSVSLSAKATRAVPLPGRPSQAPSALPARRLRPHRRPRSRGAACPRSPHTARTAGAAAARRTQVRQVLEDVQVDALSWSPDSRRIAFTQSERRGDGRLGRHLRGGTGWHG